MPEILISDLDSRLQKQVENARFAIDRGNLDYAIEICSGVLEAQPGCLPVRKLLRAAQMKRAKGKNKFMTKTFGGISAAPFLMSGSSKVKKDPSKALDAAEKALTKDPSNGGAHKLLAQAAKAMELPETVAFAWECIRDHSPENISVLLSLGNAYVEANRGEDAVAVGEQILRLQPGNAEAQELLKTASVSQSLSRGGWESEDSSYRDKLKDAKEAVALEQASKFVTGEDATKELIEQAIQKSEAEPKNLNHYRTIVDGYQQIKDFDKAIEWLDKARQTEAGAADATLAKQYAELQLKKLEGEIAAKEAELAANPDNPELTAEIASLKESFAKVRLEEMQALVERYPNDYNQRFEFGKMLYEADEMDKAISQFQHALRSPKVRLQALTYLGSCFKTKKQYDLAVEQLTQAKGEISGMSDAKKEITYQLAECYEGMGEREKAIAEYKQIYSADIGYRNVAQKIDEFYAKG